MHPLPTTTATTTTGSTGPKTTEGKLRVRCNSLSHGLSGMTCMLPTDSLEAYNKLGALLLKTWAPETEDEFRLVAVLHDTQWRLFRIPALEMDLETSGLIEQYDNFADYAEPVRSSLARAAAFRANAKMLDQIHRHEGRLIRLLDSTKQELSGLIQQRREAQIAASRKALAAKAAAAQAQTQSPVGFELQPKPAQPETARPLVPTATHPATRVVENR